MQFDTSKAVGAYAATLTALAAIFALSGFAQAPTRFAAIDVERINVREADGTLRMVIANKAKMPGIIIAGEEYANANRTQAGMIFYNDEGDENGGLVFEGAARGGKPYNVGHLSFDRWRQDQTLYLQTVEDGSERRAGLFVHDRPDAPLDFAAVRRAKALPPGPARDAALDRLFGPENALRAFLGRQADDSSQLVLRDGAGKPRLRLRVADDGAASIDFLDAAGKVVRSEVAAKAGA